MAACVDEMAACGLASSSLVSSGLACEMRKNLAEFFWFCCMKIKGK